MDNNAAERALRGPVVGRKNYYGSGSRWSARLAAVLFTILQTLELWQINPQRGLSCYLQSCAESGNRAPPQLRRFLPWEMDPAQRGGLGSTLWPGGGMKRYCGRRFTGEEIGQLCALIADNPGRTRAQLSRLACRLLQWRKADGGLKEMSCRVAMLRMHREGLLQLPPPRNRKRRLEPNRAHFLERPTAAAVPTGA